MRNHTNDTPRTQAHRSDGDPRMSNRKKQIEAEALAFDRSMRHYHDSDGVDASQCWSLGAQWADSNPQVLIATSVSSSIAPDQDKTNACIYCKGTRKVTALSDDYLEDGNVTICRECLSPQDDERDAREHCKAHPDCDLDVSVGMLMREWLETKYESFLAGRRGCPCRK